MKNIFFALSSLLLLSSCTETSQQPTNTKYAMNSSTSFYDLQVTDIDGNTFNMNDLKGKRVLIVNVASKCGFTKQYKPLQELYEKFGGNTFTIIGFPSNDFMGQEPGSEEEIKDFCEKNFGVTFPLMSKISVKGKNIHPLYKWLTQKEMNGVDDFKVKWNFHKFLVDENGQLVGDFPSSVSPLSEEIIAFAEGA